MLVHIHTTLVCNKSNTFHIPWMVRNRYSNQVMNNLYIKTRSDDRRQASRVGQFNCWIIEEILVGFW